MPFGLNLQPLVPLHPVEPDRQAAYPKALGPTFVGKPYLTFPAATAGVQDPLAAAARKVEEGRSAALESSLPGNPPAYGSTGITVPGRGTGIPGTKVDLLG
ncbi:MAG TPA: hypothetical protein VF804_03200 [Holophagaceae bacterium]